MADIKDGSLTLYYFPGSYYSMKAVHALFEKKVPFKHYLIDIHGGGDQYSTWYLKMNPNGVVPVLKHGDTIVYESEDIVDYVDKICPSANTFENWGKHKKVLLSKHPELKEELEKKTKRNEEFRNAVFDKAKVMKLLDDLDNIFDVLETQLQKTVSAHVNTAYSGLWLFGSEMTAADITAQVFLNRMRMLGLIERYCGNGKRPLVEDYLMRMNQRPAVQEIFACFKYVPRLYLKSMVKSKLPIIGTVLTAGLMLTAAYFVYQKNK